MTQLTVHSEAKSKKGSSVFNKQPIHFLMLQIVSLQLQVLLPTATIISSLACHNYQLLACNNYYKGTSTSYIWMKYGVYTRIRYNLSAVLQYCPSHSKLHETEKPTKHKVVCQITGIKRVEY